ncbi:MAG: glycosyltransferase family 4 protein [Patescibacteria group bacterium]
MRIVVCSLTYPLPNGVSSSVNESVDGFVKAGHDVVIISPDYGVGQARPEHRPVTSSVLARAVVRFIGKKERMFGISSKAEIEAIINDFGPDAFWLHTITWASNTFERIMLSSDKAKILTYHTMLDMYGRLYAGAVGEQRMIARSRKVANAVDRVITPSHYMEGRLHGYGVTKPIDVIATGITKPAHYIGKGEFKRRYQIRSDHDVLMYVGRVVKEKNIEALLNALKLVLKEHRHTTLVLVGPGDIEETMAQANEMGIADHVRCTGQLSLSQAKTCYSAADLFVFTSQSETQGLVVGEAMIVGLPVVALVSPIQPEIYPAGTAFLANNVTELASQIVRALGNEELREHIAQTGKEFVSANFTKEIMIQKQLRTFEQAIADNAAAPAPVKKVFANIL